MTTTHTPTDDIAVAFFAPHDMRGKWHAKRLVTGEADCGAGTLLGNEVIHATKRALSDRTYHPIICRRCAKLNNASKSSLRVVK